MNINAYPYGHRIPWIEDVLVKRELGLPHNALGGQAATWQTDDENRFVIGIDGGIIRCADENVAKEMIRIAPELDPSDHLTLYDKLESAVQRRLGPVKCDMYGLFYQAAFASTISAEYVDVVDIPADEVRANPPENMTSIGLREGSLVLSYVSAIPKFEVDGHIFYWIGAQTHPDYRRRGLAKACVSAMFRKMGNKSVAILHNSVKNTASVSHAISCGFTHLSWSFVWNL